MEFARSSAVSERTEYVVLFDPTEGEYWLSLLELLDRESGNTVTDASRESLTESLEALAEADMDEELADEDEDEEDTAAKGSQTAHGSVEERQETELHCPHCFLLVQATAIAETGECGHCGGPIS